jgi:hypothetical protein|uniref:Uncharacterized protein n=1 Tax=Eutreptiella gymnastica TaxID=73025 RepID=A0A7S4LJM6_9EUGL
MSITDESPLQYEDGAPILPPHPPEPPLPPYLQFFPDPPPRQPLHCLCFGSFGQGDGQHMPPLRTSVVVYRRRNFREFSSTFCSSLAPKFVLHQPDLLQSDVPRFLVLSPLVSRPEEPHTCPVGRYSTLQKMYGIQELLEFLEGFPASNSVRADLILAASGDQWDHSRKSFRLAPKPTNLSFKTTQNNPDSPEPQMNTVSSQDGSDSLNEVIQDSGTQMTAAFLIPCSCATHASPGLQGGCFPAPCPWPQAPCALSLSLRLRAPLNTLLPLNS